MSDPLNRSREQELQLPFSRMHLRADRQGVIHVNGMPSGLRLGDRVGLDGSPLVTDVLGRPVGQVGPLGMIQSLPWQR